MKGIPMGFINKNEEYKHQKIVVDLTERSMYIRIFFIAVALTIAGYAFYNIFTSVLRTEPGWQTIPVSKTVTTAGDEFVFRYNLGGSGKKPAEDWTSLTEKYPKLLDHSYQIFSLEAVEGIGNLAVLNQHPNESVQIEPELYHALQLLEDNACRYLYYAPVYEQYRGLFGCENDYDADQFDPASNAEVNEYVVQAIAYAANPDSIHIELLENQSARLVVSADYLTFAEENEITHFLDFFFWKNAFVIDCVADQLIQDGYTAGIISCEEGFNRPLGEGEFTIPLFAIKDNAVTQAQELSYRDATAVISLYDFPIAAKQMKYYFTRQDGSIRNPFIDVDNGLYKSKGQGLVVYSGEMGCSELIMNVWQSFMDGSQDYQDLKAKEIFFAY